MKDIADRLIAWNDAGLEYAVATVVAVSGSAPRSPGAAMAVASDGQVVGSVSGGCVESAVYALCEEVLSTGVSVRRSFGYSDDNAFAVGLTCGGEIEVFVSSAPDPAILQFCAGAFATVQLLDSAGTVLGVWPDRHLGTTGFADIDRIAVDEARAMLDAGSTGIRSVRCRPGVEMFIASYAPAPRLIVFGAIDYAGALTRLGGFLGYRVTLCDARPVFATPARFPSADEVIVEWPHTYLERTVVDARTVVCVLTHDAKFDIPLLRVALRLPVAFVGAMGSRRTHRDRLARLRQVGMTETELSRLHSPIGLDLGASTPEETAVAIAAEFVAALRGGSGMSLTVGEGPIHHSTVPDRRQA